MKRLSFLMITMLMSVSLVMAQGGRRGGERNVDPKARAERMTENMAKEYSLNDSQKKQVLEANLALMETMGQRPVPTAKAENKKEKPKTECKCKDENKKCENCKEAKKGKKTKAAKLTKSSKVSKEDREARHNAMKEARSAYDAKLKQIMTQEQYDSYTKKQAERQAKAKKDGPQRRRPARQA